MSEPRTEGDMGECGALGLCTATPASRGRRRSSSHGGSARARRKATGLWLNGLPKLEPTNIVPERVQKVHLMGPSPDRWRERSRTYLGIAQAMAQQWGAVLRADAEAVA